MSEVDPPSFTTLTTPSPQLNTGTSAHVTNTKYLPAVESQNDERKILEDLSKVRKEKLREDPSRVKEKLQEDPSRVKEKLQEDPSRVKEKLQEDPSRVKEKLQEDPSRVKEKLQEDPSRVKEEDFSRVKEKVLTEEELCRQVGLSLASRVPLKQNTPTPERRLKYLNTPKNEDLVFLFTDTAPSSVTSEEEEEGEEVTLIESGNPNSFASDLSLSQNSLFDSHRPQENNLEVVAPQDGTSVLEIQSEKESNPLSGSTYKCTSPTPQYTSTNLGFQIANESQPAQEQDYSSISQSRIIFKKVKPEEASHILNRPTRLNIAPVTSEKNTLDESQTVDKSYSLAAPTSSKASSVSEEKALFPESLVPDTSNPSASPTGLKPTSKNKTRFPESDTTDPLENCSTSNENSVSQEKNKFLTTSSVDVVKSMIKKSFTQDTSVLQDKSQLEDVITDDTTFQPAVPIVPSTESRSRDSSGVYKKQTPGKLNHSIEPKNKKPTQASNSAVIKHTGASSSLKFNAKKLLTQQILSDTPEVNSYESVAPFTPTTSPKLSFISQEKDTFLEIHVEKESPPTFEYTNRTIPSLIAMPGIEEIKIRKESNAIRRHTLPEIPTTSAGEQKTFGIEIPQKPLQPSKQHSQTISTKSLGKLAVLDIKPSTVPTPKDSPSSRESCEVGKTRILEARNTLRKETVPVKKITPRSFQGKAEIKIPQVSLAPQRPKISAITAKQQEKPGVLKIQISEASKLPDSPEFTIAHPGENNAKSPTLYESKLNDTASLTKSYHMPQSSDTFSGEKSIHEPNSKTTDNLSKQAVEAILDISDESSFVEDIGAYSNRASIQEYLTAILDKRILEYVTQNTVNKFPNQADEFIGSSNDSLSDAATSLQDIQSKGEEDPSKKPNDPAIETVPQDKPDVLSFQIAEVFKRAGSPSLTIPHPTSKPQGRNDFEKSKSPKSTEKGANSLSPKLNDNEENSKSSKFTANITTSKSPYPSQISETFSEQQNVKTSNAHNTETSPKNKEKTMPSSSNSSKVNDADAFSTSLSYKQKHTAISDEQSLNKSTLKPIPTNQNPEVEKASNSSLPKNPLVILSANDEYIIKDTLHVGNDNYFISRHKKFEADEPHVNDLNIAPKLSRHPSVDTIPEAEDESALRKSSIASPNPASEDTFQQIENLKDEITSLLLHRNSGTTGPDSRLITPRSSIQKEDTTLMGIYSFLKEAVDEDNEPGSSFSGNQTVLDNDGVPSVSFSNNTSLEEDPNVNVAPPTSARMPGDERRPPTRWSTVFYVWNVVRHLVSYIVRSLLSLILLVTNLVVGFFIMLADSVVHVP
ncbi:uncharacterized protein LOC131927585, partial [Physella acuta]|uniref:uncharacterized protein LOC131927585 n=1 Tax=Physella acuta TaxID=109671 RepID=UPI0027DE534A